jgi:predicted benzoate:H+ symporter BenE
MFEIITSKFTLSRGHVGDVQFFLFIVTIIFLIATFVKLGQHANYKPTLICSGVLGGLLLILSLKYVQTFFEGPSLNPYGEGWPA